MSVANTHSCFTTVTFPETSWDQTEPLLESWKSLLQGLPGYLSCDIWIRRLQNEDVHCIIQVAFEHREQLEEFIDSKWAPEQMIGGLDPSPYDITIEHFAQHI